MSINVADYFQHILEVVVKIRVILSFIFNITTEVFTLLNRMEGPQILFLNIEQELAIYSL